MAEAVLTVNQLQVAFSTRPIVRNVSFQLCPGQVLGIIGESGSGKSATCLSMLGLLPGAAVQGSARLSGQELIGLTAAELRSIRGPKIGLILQNPVSYFNPIATIQRQFIETLQSHRTLSGSAARSVAVEQLIAVGFPDPLRVLRQFPFQLSGGMLQRVMIAIALSLQPQVLVADEPTTALDVITQIQILGLIKQLQQQNHCALLLVTHDLGVIAQLADQVAVMRNGELVEQTSVEQLFDNPQHPYTQTLLASRLTQRQRVRR
ncbi:ABC transporter ATP-binding protein [Rivularia sp. UHCC 0363]|uniref:ABC transporter ATP-binding protein n=1 Tax=Rivularia sp. UHCC 0363 TaxID=3110244 RepID=UPI002B20050F|nr:ABC transporter ATP-binding protein [Rivularia sp. UHCC 0363]MEA5598826.1 ABC transporter ATP-binding protein [Rivularia sp. UHCC 0363]